jgi:hypothetical protein
VSEAPAVGEVRDLGVPREGGDGVEVPFGEELLRDCLAEFPHVRLTVTGRCMEPALAHGEKVLLVSAARRRPRVGDVVLARQKEGLRLHRLVFGPAAGPPGALAHAADRGLLLDPPLARRRCRLDRQRRSRPTRARAARCGRSPRSPVPSWRA